MRFALPADPPAPRATAPQAKQKFQVNLELLPWESLGVRGGSSGVPGESPGVLGLPGCSLGASKNIEKTLVFIVFPA